MPELITITRLGIYKCPQNNGTVSGVEGMSVNYVVEYPLEFRMW